MKALPYKLVRPDALWHFVLYWSPRDYPGRAVVRGWIIAPGVADPIPTDWVAIYETVAQARRALSASPNLCCTPRMPDDDPGIVETWI